MFDYAKSRLVSPGAIRNREQLQEVVDRSVRIQSKIWPATMSAVGQEGKVSGSEKVLLVSAVNDLLDAHWENRSCPAGADAASGVNKKRPRMHSRDRFTRLRSLGFLLGT